jgi:hypothetical protein
MSRHAPIRTDETKLLNAVIGMANRPSALLDCTASALLDTFGREKAILLADQIAGAVANEDARRKRIAAVTDCRDVLQINPALTLHDARAISFERDPAPPVDWPQVMVWLLVIIGLVVAAMIGADLWDMQAEAQARQVEEWRKWR